MLPSVVQKGKTVLKGTLIKLFYEVCIAWDSRIITHCTSLNKVGDNNNVYGNFFTSKK